MAEANNSGQTKVLLLIIAVLLIVVVGGGVYLFLNQRASAQQAALQSKKIGPTVSLGEFTVNLADNRSFIRTTVVLELNGKELQKELTERDAQIKHSVISTLRLIKPEQIAGENGIDNLCSRLKENINNLLITGSVVNVYFTQLVIQ
ncbi:MAG TPA: hypothetical protein GXX38_01730 [Clostridia bacterium]|jgi:flagellar FliL protein|nr:hypothetical protein [Clostridia bacterium]